MSSSVARALWRTTLSDADADADARDDDVAADVARPRSAARSLMSLARRAFELGSALGVGVTRGCSLYIGGVNVNIYLRRWGRSFTYLVSY